MSEYDGRQFVGIDLHRRRSVIVRTTDAGEALEAVRINNDLDSLAAVIARAGEAPEVVLEATYGWYWAVDALQAAGAVVRLAQPLGVKGFAYRRVKNDVRDASDLADLLRMGRLPQAWVAPPRKAAEFEVDFMTDMIDHHAMAVMMAEFASARRCTRSSRRRASRSCRPSRRRSPTCRRGSRTGTASATNRR